MLENFPEIFVNARC